MDLNHPTQKPKKKKKRTSDDVAAEAAAAGEEEPKKKKSKKAKKAVEEEEDATADQSAAEPVPEYALSKFPLSAATVTALTARGIDRLFPIQGQTFKHIFEGRDLIGQASISTC